MDVRRNPNGLLRDNSDGMLRDRNQAAKRAIAEASETSENSRMPSLHAFSK